MQNKNKSIKSRIDGYRHAQNADRKDGKEEAEMRCWMNRKQEGVEANQDTNWRRKHE